MALSLSPNNAAALLCLLSLLTHNAVSLPPDSIVSDLSTLQSESPSGVIRLTDALLRRILSLPTPRPFHFIIFFDAQKLHSNPQLSLPTLKSEFTLVSSSFLSNNPHNKSDLFFFDVELEDSRASFALAGVNSLPHIRLFPPSANDPITDSIKMEASDLSGLATSMAEFIVSRTNLPVGPIVRPPIISRTQIIILTTIILISAPFLIKKLISGNTILHEKSIYMAGAIFVYFFSVSGAMFNIIRKMPMVLLDRNDPMKMVFFYRGSGMQLGAEGFTIGSLFTMVGLLLAFQCHVMVRVKNRKLQRLTMIVILFLSVLTVKKVILLNNWKTGYRVRAYWPSRWR
ncbi:hypothetical protein ACS0TY_031920 [Phlomoides rotata]